MADVWILKADSDTLDKVGIEINCDYDNCDVDRAKLINPHLLDSRSGTMRYLYKGRGFEPLSGFDLYPADASIPLVSSRLKSLIKKICDPTEVTFFDAEIADRDKKILPVFCVVPLVCKSCTDLKKSKVKRYFPNTEIPQSFESVRFYPDCLGANNILRNDGPLFVLVSDQLKNAIEELNPRGVHFLRDVEYKNIF